MSARKEDKTAAEKPQDAKSDTEDLDEIARKSLVKYGDESCPICGSRYDEYGYCACGAGGN